MTTACGEQFPGDHTGEFLCQLPIGHGGRCYCQRTEEDGSHWEMQWPSEDEKVLWALAGKPLDYWGWGWPER